MREGNERNFLLVKIRVKFGFFQKRQDFTFLYFKHSSISFNSILVQNLKGSLCKALIKVRERVVWLFSKTDHAQNYSIYPKAR